MTERGRSNYRSDNAVVTTPGYRGVSVHVTPDQFKALDGIAREAKVSRGEMARRLLVLGLEGESRLCSVCYKHVT